MNTFPEPKTDADAMAIHALRLATMDAAERAAYLDDFSGRQVPPPTDGTYPRGKGRSLREVLGDDGTAALLARADQVKPPEPVPVAP